MKQFLLLTFVLGQLTRLDCTDGAEFAMDKGKAFQYRNMKIASSMFRAGSGAAVEVKAPVLQPPQTKIQA